MADFLPQDVLDSIISHITDIDTLSQCALASRLLLHQSRRNQFANGVRITSKNRNLISSILSSACFFIPPHALRAITISGVRFAEIDSGRNTTVYNKLLTRPKHANIQPLELDEAQWPSFSAITRHMLSNRLPFVTQLDLRDLAVSSKGEFIEFIESFPRLTHLRVERVDISSILSSPTDARDESMPFSHHGPASPHPSRKLKRLELVVDDSDSLSIIQAASIRLQFSRVVLWRSPYDESTRSYAYMLDDTLRNMGGTLVDLTFIISGSNAILASPSDLSHNINLERVNAFFLNMNLRRVGSQAFSALLTTLSESSIPPSSLDTRPRLKETNLTFHFTHPLRHADCDHLCSVWNWEALDEVITSATATSPSSSGYPRSVSSFAGSPAKSEIVSKSTSSLETMSLSFDCGYGKADGEWMGVIEDRIRSRMRRCQSQGILRIHQVDTSEYVKKR